MKVISKKQYNETIGKAEEIFERQLKQFLKEKYNTLKLFYFERHGNNTFSVESINFNEKEIRKFFDDFEQIDHPQSLTSSILPAFTKKKN